MNETNVATKPLGQEEACKRIERLRQEIDAYNSMLVQLLAGRFACVKKIGEIKRSVRHGCVRLKPGSCSVSAPALLGQGERYTFRTSCSPLQDNYAPFEAGTRELDTGKKYKADSGQVLHVMHLEYLRY